MSPSLSDPCRACLCVCARRVEHGIGTWCTGSGVVFSRSLLAPHCRAIAPNFVFVEARNGVAMKMDHFENPGDLLNSRSKLSEDSVGVNVSLL